jgi:hypothetical protein
MTAGTQAAQPPRPFWAAPICHPLPLATALLMALNDHWLKASDALPELVTGKLSDLCGLFFFPALLTACAWGCFALARRRAPTWLPTLAVVATGVCFTLANLSRPVNAWLGSVWIDKMMDPTDLLALPVLALSWLWIRRDIHA